VSARQFDWNIVGKPSSPRASGPPAWTSTACPTEPVIGDMRNRLSNGIRVAGCQSRSGGPLCSSGKALGEAVGVSEVGKVTTVWQNSNDGLGENLVEPPAIVGLLIAAGDDEVGNVRSP
jgi:hypothetical protein